MRCLRRTLLAVALTAIVCTGYLRAYDDSAYAGISWDKPIAGVFWDEHQKGVAVWRGVPFGIGWTSAGGFGAGWL